MSQLVLSQPFSGRSSFVAHVRLMVFLAMITVLICALSPTLVSKVPAAMPGDLIFVPNMGQADASVQFQAHQGGNRWLFTQDEIIYSWVVAEESHEVFTDIPSPLPQVSIGTLSQQFLGANENAQFAATNPLAGKVNYLLGNDSTRWYTNLPTYATFRTKEFYPGIQVTYQGQENILGTQFTVHPGIDIAQVRWQYPNAESVSINELGQLSLVLPNIAETITIPTPTARQFVAGHYVFVDIQYVQLSSEVISWHLGDYDLTANLIVDTQMPALSFAYDRVEDVFVGGQGHAYVVGFTSSTDFPMENPLQSTSVGQFDAFITQFTPDGTGLMYSTFLGGTGFDMASSISEDDTGYMYVVGTTDSLDFPVLNPWQANYHGVFDSFVVKLSPDGSSMVFGTYLGGNNVDAASQVVNDVTGNAYFTGVTHSCDFPLSNPLQGVCAGNEDAFVSKLSSDGQTLIFSTYLGGDDYDAAYSLDVDAQSNAYVIGETRSPDFPLMNPFQNTLSGISDVFVSKLDSTGQALTYSTYLGGNTSEVAGDIAVHDDGTVFVAGMTGSIDFPLLDPFQNLYHGNNDIFISRMNQAGNSLVYSTYLGGSDTDTGLDIEVDDDGNMYVTGMTHSTDFPMMNAIQPANGGYQDTVVAKINANGSALVFSTYVGGESSEFVSSIAIDPDNNVYVAGETWSGAYPTTVGAWQENYAGGGDGFVTKILADGSAFGYSTYLGGGFPTDVTLSGMSGTTYDSWLVGSMIGGVGLLVMGYWVWCYRQGRKGIV